jgi:flagellar assembly protein FliH
MTAIRKFLFDLDFAVAEKAASEKKSEEQEEQKEEEPEQEIPTFSEEEMARSREEGIAAGREIGIKEAAEATERRIQDTLQAMQGRITELFASQKEANETMARDAVLVAAAMAQKALPDLNRRNALGEVELLVERAMETVIGHGHFKVRVNGELHEPLEERIKDMVAGRGFEDRLSVIADDGIEIGDCKIDWGDGGVVRNFNAILKDVDAIFEANMNATPGVAEKTDETDKPEKAAGGDD